MKKRVALVLGSGGARGYAHIGVIEEIERRGYDIACIAGCSMGAVVGGIYAAGKLDEYRNWIESLDYLDVLRLVDVSFRLGAIRGEKVFGQIRKIVGEITIEQLRIPYTAVATDLTNQQEIWFQEGCLHQAMRASAAIPSLFTPVMQGNRMLVDGGLLNPLPIVPVVSSHCDLIIAVNLNATNQKHYHLPVIQRPPAFKSRFNNLAKSLGSHLPFRRKQAEQLMKLEQEALEAQAAEINPWLESAAPESQQPAAAPEKPGAPKSATGSSTTLPREILIKIVSGPISANCSAPISFSVSAVSGSVRQTKSACCSKSFKLRYCAPKRVSTDGLGEWLW